MDKENKVEFIDDEEIITLYDDKDQPVDFYEIACIEYEEELYVLLQPVEVTEGIEEDEAIICKIEPQDDETDMFLPIEDQDLLEKIFDEYLKAVADHESGCGCGCDDCDKDCDCDEECGDEEECDCHKK